MNKIAIRAKQGANEKKPWRALERPEGVVESEFFFPVHLGETILPYRALAPMRAIIPIDSKGNLQISEEQIQFHPGLEAWWRNVNGLWERYRTSQRLSLQQQVDYLSKLTTQFPLAPLRVVYTKSGMHLGAAMIEDHRAVVDHTLYWAALASRDEGAYLCAILNSAIVTKLVRPLMSFGKDERHIDKYVWKLPIPAYVPGNSQHSSLATLGHQAIQAIGTLSVSSTKHFSATRREIRTWLQDSELGSAIEQHVQSLLNPLLT